MTYEILKGTFLREEVCKFGQKTLIVEFEGKEKPFQHDGREYKQGQKVNLRRYLYGTDTKGIYLLKEDNPESVETVEIWDKQGIENMSYDNLYDTLTHLKNVYWDIQTSVHNMELELRRRKTEGENLI